MSPIPYRHPATRYVRDYQTLPFSLVTVSSKTAQTANLTLSTRFIVRKLVCTTYYKLHASLNITQVDEAPLLTLFKIGPSPMDAVAVPLRSAWGTARNPTILDVPIALETGQSLSVDVDPGLGQVPAVSAGRYFVQFSLVGYIPTQAEYEAIRNYNRANFIREWATNSLSSLTAFDYAAKTAVSLQTDFPNDLMVTSLTGAAFDQAADAAGFALDFADPVNLIQLFTKAALLNSPDDAFRNVVGTAKFPAPVNPAMLIKAQDRVIAKISDVGTGGNVVMPSGGTNGTARFWVTARGYVPSENMLRAAAVQRGDTYAVNPSGPPVVLPSRLG